MTIELKFKDLVKFDYNQFAWPEVILERNANGNTKLYIVFYNDRPHVINIHNDTHIFQFKFSKVDECSLIDFSFKHKGSLVNQSYIISNVIENFPVITSLEKIYIKLKYGLDFSLINFRKDAVLTANSLLKIRQRALFMGKEYQRQHAEDDNHPFFEKAHNWIKQNEKLIG